MQARGATLVPMARWKRVEPGEEDNGDAVETYTRTAGCLLCGVTPISSGITQSDSGQTRDATMYRVIVSFDHPFTVGDRLGPIGADAPTMEVMSCKDYPGSQNMEVRAL